MDESNYISTDPFSFSFDNMPYRRNRTLREFHEYTLNFQKSIHEKVKAYLQKHGKNINPKNPPKKFNITIKTTPDENSDTDLYAETWELSITYAPNEYSPLNTIHLKYRITDTLFNKMMDECIYDGC